MPEQASKLKFGPLQYIVTELNSFQLVHIDAAPLVVTVLAQPTANLGLLLHAIPQILGALAPLRAAARTFAVAE